MQRSPGGALHAWPGFAPQSSQGHLASFEAFASLPAIALLALRLNRGALDTGRADTRRLEPGLAATDPVTSSLRSAEADPEALEFDWAAGRDGSGRVRW